MLVAKNVLSLMIELGLVILCKGLWLSFDRAVPTDPCLLAGESNSEHGESLMTKECMFPL